MRDIQISKEILVHMSNNDNYDNNNNTHHKKSHSQYFLGITNNQIDLMLPFPPVLP